MRALVVRSYTSDLTALPVEDDWPEPGAPAGGEVQVEIQSVAVNFYDLLMVTGEGRSKHDVRPEFPFVPGSEFAGVVTAIGEDDGEEEPPQPAPAHTRGRERPLAVGDVVFGGVLFGAYTQRLNVAREWLWRAPPAWRLSMDQVSTLGTTFPTSYYALAVRGDLLAEHYDTPGAAALTTSAAAGAAAARHSGASKLRRRPARVLVHGGGGGQGCAAVQVAKALGAWVVATAGSAEKLELCRRCGADAVVNYRKDKGWAKSVRKLTGDAGVDVVFDPVGLVPESCRCAAWGGRILVVGFAAGVVPRMAASAWGRLQRRNLSLVGVHWAAFARHDPAGRARVLRELGALLAARQLNPVVFADKTYDGLDRAGAAMDDLAMRRTWGKVVVHPCAAAPVASEQPDDDGTAPPKSRL